jgi:hypothetical protein
LFSDLLQSGDAKDARAGLQTHAYGLLPAFVDGWCDVMPPGIVVIDGNETAFDYESEQNYADGFARLKVRGPYLISAENRAKLRRQFLVSHGIYLDAYVGAAGKKPTIELKGRGSADRLMSFANSALDAADGFVWVYGENGRWWPNRSGREAWPRKFPGIEKAFRGAKDPGAFAIDFLQGHPPAVGLTNRWNFWQEAGSKGTSAGANEEVRLMGMKYGTASQSVPVRPGEIYAIGAKIKSSGRGDAAVAIGWQSAESNWTAANKRVEFAPADAADGEGWRSVGGLVFVPPGAARLAFLLVARGQDADGAALFANPVLARVSKQ